MAINLAVNASNMGDDEAPSVLQWVTFCLEGEVYGVNVMQVQEVLRFSEITPVPGAPHYVIGIINLRGNVVTVIDTRRRFGLSPEEITDNSRIVIVEIEQHVVGLLVDSVAEVVYIEASEIEATPNMGRDDAAQYIQGVYNQKEHLLILIDLRKLLSSQEWQELESLG